MAIDSDGNYIADAPVSIVDPSGNYVWDGFTWSINTIPKAPGEALKPRDPGTYDTNGTYNPLIMGTGDKAASNTTAAILRGNYENWKTQFFPKVGELMDMTTYKNPGLVGQETAKAAEQVGKTFDTVQASQQRGMARYGMNQTAEATESLNREMELSRTAATVNATNGMRQYLSDRNRAIAAGGLPAAVAGGS